MQTAGINTFSTDDAVTTAVFALSSRLFAVDLVGDAPVRELTTHIAVVDPRLDPTGSRVAFAGDRGVHVVELDGGASRLLVAPDPGEADEVVWGLAEFIAAEELGRSHGFWWAPDGERLLVERYDESPVSVWYISDPAHPELPPRATRYPQCGTANALVSLAVVPVDGGAPVPVDWRSDVELDGKVFEYLAHDVWSGERPVITVLTRDQRTLQYRDLDPATGRTKVRQEVSDDAWVELTLRGMSGRRQEGYWTHVGDLGSAERWAALVLQRPPGSSRSVRVDPADQPGTPLRHRGPGDERRGGVRHQCVSQGVRGTAGPSK